MNIKLVYLWQESAPDCLPPNHRFCFPLTLFDENVHKFNLFFKHRYFHLTLNTLFEMQSSNVGHMIQKILLWFLDLLRVILLGLIPFWKYARSLFYRKWSVGIQTSKSLSNDHLCKTDMKGMRIQPNKMSFKYISFTLFLHL